MTRDERVLARLESLEVDGIGIGAEPWLAYPPEYKSVYSYKYRLHHNGEVQKWRRAVADSIDANNESYERAWFPMTGKFATLIRLAVVFK